MYGNNVITPDYYLGGAFPAPYFHLWTISMLGFGDNGENKILNSRLSVIAGSSIY